MSTAPHLETRQVAVDIRRNGDRFRDFLVHHGGSLILLMLAVACASPIGDGWADLIFPVGALFFLLARFHVHRAGWPLRAPFFAHCLDPKDLGPYGHPKEAAGIYYIGQARDGSGGVWLTAPDLRAHLYPVGVSGAGKTQLFHGMLFNALMQGSAATNIDGKGELTTWEKDYAIVRRFGREDDLLLVSYATGGKDVFEKTPRRRMSNTDNAMALWDSSSLTEMMMALQDQNEASDPYWIGRCESFIRAIMPPLVWRREEGIEPLSPKVVRKYLDLTTLEQLARDARMPPDLMGGVLTYLSTLPGGFDPQAPAKGSGDAVDPETARQQQLQMASRGEQHSYVAQQLVNSLGLLADQYGYISATPYPEVDWLDVAVHRRIVVVILPALGKSEKGAESLGRIVIANLKGMMARILGSKTERRVGEYPEPRITRADHPYYIIEDEKPAYMVPGEDVIFQEARSLGFCMAPGAQSHKHMQDKLKTVADAIAGAATRTKLFLGLEDPDTLDLARQLTGEVWRGVPGGYQPGALQPVQENRTTLQKDAFLDPMTVKAQRDGQALLVATIQTQRGEIQRGVWINTFYVPDFDVPAIHLNHLMPLLSMADYSLISEGALAQDHETARAPKPARSSHESIAKAEGNRRKASDEDIHRQSALESSGLRELGQLLGMPAEALVEEASLFATIERVLKEKLAGAPVPMDTEGEALQTQLLRAALKGPQRRQ
ncbi:MAG: hypothetical protein WCY91_06540 [Acidithiobacillus sp.]